MQGGGLGGSLSSLHYPFYPGGLKGNAASNVWLSLHTTPTIRFCFFPLYYYHFWWWFFCGILLFHRIKAVDFFPLVSAEFSLLSSAYTSLMPLMMMIYAYSHLLNIFWYSFSDLYTIQGWPLLKNGHSYCIAYTQICLMLKKAFHASYSGTSEATAVWYSE